MCYLLAGIGTVPCCVFKIDAQWNATLRLLGCAGPRIRHYYRGKIESGPALQPLAEWYGIGSSRAQENVIVATAEQQHAKDTVSVLEKNLAAAVQSVSSNGGVDQTTRARVRVDKEEEYVNVWLKLLHCDLWVYTDEACKNVFAHMWLGGASVLETTTEGGRKRAQSRWGSVRASALELDTQKAAESVYTLDVRLGLLPAQGPPPPPPQPDLAHKHTPPPPSPPSPALDRQLALGPR